MKIIEPKVELIPFDGNCIEHVAKCARVCYGKESGNDEHLYKSLFNSKHWSMFRHETHYYIIPRPNIPIGLRDIYDAYTTNNIKICGINIQLYKEFYVICNGNFLLDNPIYESYLKTYEVSPEYFANVTKESFNMMRYTFKVTTQISTSRELNRVSPNNIAEKSTRYVYEDGSICRPHWLEGYNISQTLDGIYLIYKYGKEDTDINHKVLTFINSCNSSFKNYKYLVDAGLPREDARGVLPFDTATKVIYTYSIKEWRDIIDLRYYGTTGKPHPNAYIIAGMIKDELEKLGYNFREK